VRREKDDAGVFRVVAPSATAAKPKASANMAYAARQAYLPQRTELLLDRAGMGDAYASSVKQFADTAVTAVAGQLEPVLLGSLQTLVAAELGLTGKLGRSAAAYVTRAVQRGMQHVAHPVGPTQPPKTGKKRSRKATANATATATPAAASAASADDGSDDDMVAVRDVLLGAAADDDAELPPGPAAAAAARRPAAKKRLVVGGNRPRQAKGEAVDAAFAKAVDEAVAGQGPSFHQLATFDLLARLEALAILNNRGNAVDLPEAVFRTRSPYIHGLHPAMQRHLRALVRRMVACLPAAFSTDHVGKSPMAAMATMYIFCRCCAHLPFLCVLQKP
jgi:hypothetical protein